MDLRHANGEIKGVFALRLSPSVDLLPFIMGVSPARANTVQLVSRATVEYPSLL